ncbi:MAG: glycosyltransferase [Acidobacteriota bacterium]
MLALTFLYPPTIEFEWLVQRPQQLMTAFAQLGNKVVYMNPTANEQKAKRTQRPLPNLYVLNGQDPHQYLQQKPVYYFSCTAHIEHAAQYDPSLVVFDFLDEAVEEFEMWSKYKTKALKKSDLVITTSKKLLQQSLLSNPNTVMVPNGCDYAFFSQAQKQIFEVPPDMWNIRHPIIGYHGAVASWLDFSLIRKIARNFPDYSLVMVGPLYNVSEVPQEPNIHWLGLKPYHVLPAYAQQFDVGIVPFRISPMTEAVNPIKMWEYLAAGLPVVSTALPEVKDFPEVCFSRNDKEFLDNIKDCLINDSPEKRQARINLAHDNSWTTRAQKILESIHKILNEKAIKKSSRKISAGSQRAKSAASFASERLIVQNNLQTSKGIFLHIDTMRSDKNKIR